MACTPSSYDQKVPIYGTGWDFYFCIGYLVNTPNINTTFSLRCIFEFVFHTITNESFKSSFGICQWFHFFSLPQIWFRYHWCDLKACWGTVRFHWHLLFHEGCNPSCCRNHSHVIEEHEASPNLLEVSANTKFFDKENPFLSIISYTPCYEGLALMPFNVWFGRFVCFIYIALYIIWHTSFSF